MGEPVTDSDIPPPAPGQAALARPTGKIIYGKGITFKGGSHSSPLRIIPDSKAKDMASRLPAVPASPSNHMANFLLACQKAEEARSPFSIAGPLCQFMALGVVALRLNANLKFDRDTKQVINNKLANDLLAGAPPRAGWEQYYKM
jgi:hypothetical protein